MKKFKNLDQAKRSFKVAVDNNLILLRHFNDSYQLITDNNLDHYEIILQNVQNVNNFTKDQLLSFQICNGKMVESIELTNNDKSKTIYLFYCTDELQKKIYILNCYETLVNTIRPHNDLTSESNVVYSVPISDNIQLIQNQVTYWTITHS